MRLNVDKGKLNTFMAEVGRAAQSSGRVYLVGGSTALLLGIREQTIDIDLKLDPEPKGIFESIALLKERLSINVELASPDHFIPAIPGWEERSEFIRREGVVDFYHYDFYGQALAKILRGHGKDIEDSKELVRLGKVKLSQLIEYFETIKPDIIRYPSVNVDAFGEAVISFVNGMESEGA